MEFVNIHQAKTHLSKYIERVNKNHDIIIICKNGAPVGQLTEYTHKTQRKIGISRGKINISENFDDDLPNELLERYK